ncbi:Dna polymerase delta subunit like [Thalictrum thalictroides]|uniref:DNA polymerase delta subunit 3 n=1 Tax=Thalictrum thalictroides TaxID=46969 RepID=A0A7J6VZQ9_THATH|nr:Dna polymerase delta subunit like [Thalictrum thalictroides]
MREAGTLDILGEIHALVSDKLQVVSYKWLSRNFSVSSNDAKRILQEFVEQNGNGLEIVYCLSGFLKESSPVYRIQFVSGVKLAEAKKQFEDNCSLQVYSVQACVPKDPAAIWNAEFVQAEELFDQPSTLDNCLRDNRFCGVSNSFVKRNVNGPSLGVAPPLSKNAAGITISPKVSNAPQTPAIPQQKAKVQQSSLKSRQSPTVTAPVVKTESNATDSNAQARSNVGKVTAVPANKKKVNEKSSSGTSGSLANMWGRASVKLKPACAPETNKDVQNPIGNLVTAEAQICAHEAMDTLISDDDNEDAQCVSHKRTSNGEGKRKRQVVFDSSDEDDFEDAVNLASPDPPKKNSSPISEINTKTLLVEKKNLNFESPAEDQTEIKQEKTTERESKLPPKEDEVVVSLDKTNGKSVKTLDPKDEALVINKATDDVSNSTKRKRVCKTRIDDRGREVTEVVWEGEETENKNTDKKDTVTETANNRPTGAKKSPAFASKAPSNPVGKAGAKKAGKGGVKDGKQGNIMSFFKKV